MNWILIALSFVFFDFLSLSTTMCQFNNNLLTTTSYTTNLFISWFWFTLFCCNLSFASVNLKARILYFNIKTFITIFVVVYFSIKNYFMTFLVLLSNVKRNKKKTWKLSVISQVISSKEKFRQVRRKFMIIIDNDILGGTIWAIK